MWNDAIVLDTGSSTIKAGVAGDDTPSVVFPNVIGKPKYKKAMVVQSHKNEYVGNEAMKLRGVLTLDYPIKNGIISDWDAAEKIFHHMYQELHLPSKRQPVLFTEPPWNPKRNREKTTELFFENLEVPQFYIALQAILGVYASGRGCAFVLDIGEGVSHMIPVFEGYTVREAITRVNMGGRDITQNMASLLNQRGHSFFTTAELEIVRELKEQTSYVALNFNDETRNQKVKEVNYELPDGRIISVGEERFTRQHHMQILGLGNSVGTPSTGITAQPIVVSSWDDLAAKASQIPGKIVVYNVPFTTYGATVQYRSNGASQAAKYGAVAALVRSVTPFSLYTPHTGAMWYDSSLPMIPTAAITVEDAELLARLQAQNVPVTLSLYMEAHQADLTSSWNVMAEVVGSVYPDQVVVLGGHSDSWDVGQGAIDDGAGFFTAWEAVRIISDLVNEGQIPRPKRTIRVVLWVDEEISGRGGQTYLEDHKSELDNHILAMESDSGNFGPTGFSFSGTADALQIMQEIGQVLLAPFGAGTIVAGGPAADISPLVQQGVPGASLNTVGSEDVSNPKNAIYFYYHHTNADTITALNVTGFKNSVATFAITSYVVADMDEQLPR